MSALRNAPATSVVAISRSSIASITKDAMYPSKDNAGDEMSCFLNNGRCFLPSATVLPFTFPHLLCLIKSMAFKAAFFCATVSFLRLPV